MSACVCPHCGGDGEIERNDGFGYEPCYGCDGSGFVACETVHPEEREYIEEPEFLP